MKQQFFSITAKQQEVNFSVAMPSELITEFEQYYYPLRQETIDLFTNNMTKPARKKLMELLQADVQDTNAIHALYCEQLQHYIDLARTSSKS